MPLLRVSLVSFLALAGAALPAIAQDYDRPPAGYGDDQGGYDTGAPDRGYDRGGGQDRGAAASDAGGVAVRVGKLESRIREMTGQIEELQNANRKLVEQLQKFQQDVESRLTSGGARSKRSETATPGTSKEDKESSTASADSPAGKVPRKGRGGDAFDPDSAPGGRPKPLGSTASNEDTGSPMDLSGGKLRRGDGDADTPAPTLRLPPKSGSDAPSADKATKSGTAVANNAPASPRAEFDLALSRYKEKQYEDAEKGFAAFIQKNPKSRLAADATYYLGESFAQRGRSREAAEQYLKVSTDFASSTRAPDAMLHLGMSLKALGAKEQACATFSEVGRKYPNAPAYVKSGVERESKRAQC